MGEGSGMEEIVTSPLQVAQQWIERSLQSRIHEEYLRPLKPRKFLTCKEGCAPYTICAEKKAASRASRLATYKTAHLWMGKPQVEDAPERGDERPALVMSTEVKFHRLADAWSENSLHVSSVSDLINDPSYQQIIDLGWKALPYLLDDLQKRKRFWFPALAAITGVRPFDPGDLSNPRRMTEAWVKWGRRKGLID